MLHRALPLAIGAALVAACSSPVRTYVAPSGSTVSGDRDIVTIAGKPRHVLLVRNESSVPITVTAVTLADCVNIHNSCGVTPVAVNIPPGARRRVFELRPQRDSLRFGYRWTFRWVDRRGAVAAEAMTAALGPAPTPSFFEVRLASDTPGVGLAPMEALDSVRTVYVEPMGVLTDRHVEHVRYYESQLNGPMAEITLTESGAIALGTLYAEFGGRLVAVMLASRVVGVPVVASERPPNSPATRLIGVPIRVPANDLAHIRAEISKRWPH